MLPAQQCEDAVGGQVGEGFGELEVVAVLLCLGTVLPALDHTGGHGAGTEEPFTDLADEVGVRRDLVEHDGTDFASANPSVT